VVFVMKGGVVYKNTARFHGVASKR